MKKKIIATMAATLMMATCLTGCGAATLYDDYQLKDYIKVGKYKGLEVEELNVDKVTTEDVNEELNSRLTAAASTKFYTEGEKVQMGDTLNIDYTGKINGKKFDGGSDEGYNLEIGSGAFIPGFEDALIGKEVGKKTIINVTFPENYDDAKVAGKDASFEVMINSATRSIAPAPKEFAKDQGFDSVKELKQDIKNDLKKTNKENAKEAQRSDALAKAAEKSKLKKVPKEIRTEYRASLKANLYNTAEQYGTDAKTLISYMGYSTVKEWLNESKDTIENEIKTDMMAQYIAEKENCMPKNKEIKEKVKQYKENGFDDKSFKKKTGMEMEEYVSKELINEKAADFIIDNAKAKKDKKDK